MKNLTPLLIILALIMTAPLVRAQYPKWEDPNSLPIWMTPEEELRKHEIGLGFKGTTPPAAPVRSIAEFERQQGVLIRYPLGISYALIADLSQHTKVYTLVTNSNYNTASTNYTNNGVNIANCEWIIVSGTDSYWTRDYGPWYVAVGDDEIAIVDFPYNRPRPYDNLVPGVMANNQNIPLYAMDVVHTGGNYMSTGQGAAASSNLVYEENNNNQNWVNQQMLSYLGIENYHVTIDPLGGIKHIDCWGKFLDVDKVLIAQVPSSDPDYDEHEEVASYFASQISPYGTPYQVFRVYKSGAQAYTNSLIVNDRVYVPISSSTPTTQDNAALNVYRQAMPGYTVVGFTGSWLEDDALHCRVKEMADLGMLYVRHTPIHGTQPFQAEFEITADIIPYSGAALKTDSLFVIYSADGGEFDTIPLGHTQGNTYAANIPVAYGQTEITYYLFAADHSNRRENWPLIGKPGARSFQVAGPIEVYRSRQSGTWNSSDTWDQQFNDDSWQNTANVPVLTPASTTTIFPQVAGIEISAQNSRTTSHTVSLPAGIEANDLLLVFVTSPSSDNRTFSFPSGWTTLYNHDNSGLRSALIYRVASGTEGSTIQFTTSRFSRTAHNSYRIAAGTYEGVPVAGSMTTSGGSTIPDPPNLTSGFGNVKTLWIAATHSNLASVNQPPANYSNLAFIRNNGSTLAGYNATTGTARRELEAASEDPGTFTLSDSQRWSGNTIAIQGATIIVPAVKPEVTILSNHTVTVTDNQSAGNVTVEQGGVLTVNSGNSLSIAENAKLILAGQANINGSLNIADASTDGLVIENGGSLTGNVSRAATMERNISLDNWHTISAPLSGMTILGSELAPFNGTTMPVAYDLFFFDQSVAFNVDAWYPWINLRWAGSVPNPNFDTQFVGAKGYLVYYPTGSFDPSFAFKGNLNAGDLSIPLGLTLANPEGIQGWNLIGNPYPSGFDWAAAMADNTTATEDVYAYVYDDNTDQYAPVDDYVAPNQGFFVKAAAQVSFTFKDQFRAHAGTFLKNNTPLDELTLQLSHANGSDIASLRLKEGTAFERDRQDALKLYSFSPNMPQLYFLTSDGVKVAISSVPEINSETSFSLGLSTPVTGEYTLSVSELSGMFQTEPIFLRDLLTGAEQNLQQNPEYSFQAQEGTDQERFIITFAQATHVPVTSESLVNIYTWEQTLYVNFSEEGANRLLQLYDLGGRLVFSQTLDQGLSHALQMKLEQGMYLVRIQSPKGVTTQRVFVR